jgi:uncharacterized protein YjbI with pentapeptide repeats
MTVLTSITARELVQRLLAGERDFTSTRLDPSDRDLTSVTEYSQLNEYLRGLEDLRENPIVCNGVDWAGLRAPGLYFLGARLAGANLSQADLRECDIRRADLQGIRLTGADVSGGTFIGSRMMESDLSNATMKGTDLYEANLSKGVLAGCDLTGAYMLRLNLSGADLTRTKLTGVTFYRSDLRGAIGLDTAQDLATCLFKHTIVTARERDIIEAALAALPRYDLREE